MPQNPRIPNWKTEMKAISSGLYAYVQAVGGWFINNAGLIVGEDYAIVIDTLTNIPLTEKFIREIRKVTDKPVRYLVVTHSHGDHVWGSHLFKKASIISSLSCREEIAREPEFPDIDILSKLCPGIDFTGVKYTVPDLAFNHELQLFQGRREIHLIHQGVEHTLGDTIVYLPDERVVYAGDILFYYDTPLCSTGSILGWLKYLDLLLELDAGTYVPGHGPVCGKEGVLACREYFSLIHDEGRKRFDRGMTAAEAAKDIDLGKFQDWSNWRRIVTNIDRLFREFRGEGPAASLSEFNSELFAPDQP